MDKQSLRRSGASLRLPVKAFALAVQLHTSFRRKPESIESLAGKQHGLQAAPAARPSGRQLC
jgi:hypothetical protein